MKKQKLKPEKKKKKQKQLAVSHPTAWDMRGLIVKRVVANYQFYPQDFKNWVSVEDLVQEGMAWLAGSDVTAGISRLSKWDPRRGSFTTFVYRAIDNFCKSHLTFLATQKRNAKTITLDDPDVPLDVPCNPAKETENLLDAVRSVTELHSKASNELLVFLDDHFFSRRCQKAVTRGDKFNRCRREFRALASQQGVSLEMYRMVIDYHAAEKQSR